MAERDFSLGLSGILGFTFRRKSAVGKSLAPIRASLLWKTWFQQFVGRLFVLPFCGTIAFLFRFVGKYEVENGAQWRATYKKLVEEKVPTLICCNHLTFIDSALLIWALGANSWYQFNFKYFMWNLPAGDFFKKKFRYRLVAYLSKCIFIHRDGSQDHKFEILELCRRLLVGGQIVCIFPEGKRSRTGRFEPTQVTYGASRIISAVGDCRVLCFYIRSNLQDGFSNYPPKGSRFQIQLDVLHPKTQLPGKEGNTEIMSQIGSSIKKMEDNHFRNKELNSAH